MTTTNQAHDNRRSWLPTDFVHPGWVKVGDGYLLRPILPSDAELDFEAVMTSRQRLWQRYGQRFDWPKLSMTLKEDRADLARHAREAEAHESFNYVLMDDDESAVLGCVYIDPPSRPSIDAEISWWVVDAEVAGALEMAINIFVPEWISSSWPFAAPLLEPASG